ncbi:transposase, partial [Rhodomicrobium udaipurense]|nr:transposase [Rhodomicrobium udaipurense]
MGGAGKTVEIDETFACRIEDAPKGRKPVGSAFRSIALTLVERGGPARSFHVANTSLAVIIPIIRANVSRETAIMTDKASWYKNLSRYFPDHSAVDHRR